MTTIVYFDGIIAADGRITQSDIITEDDENKIQIRDGVYFVIAGSQCDEQELMNAYFSEKHKQKVDCAAIVDDSGVVYSVGVTDEGEFWKNEITNKCHCIGSGRWHAWTALDCGCSAVEAVKMAMKRDIYTGGRIRIHKCKPLSDIR